MKPSFYPIPDRGQADALYSVVTYRPGHITVVGQVVRYGKKWIACDTSGTEVTTATRRRDAAEALVAAANAT